MGKTHRYNPDQEEYRDNASQFSTEAIIKAWVEEYTDDPLLQMVLEKHLLYEGKGTRFYQPSGLDHDGIMFYRVGHNSSHEFSLGVKDGKLYLCAAGEELLDCDCVDKEAAAYQEWWAKGNSGYDCPAVLEIQRFCDMNHLDFTSKYYEVDPENLGYHGHW